MEGCATIEGVFGTLLGALPWPDPVGDRTDLDAAVRTVVRAQEEAGLEPITDGGLRHPDPFDVASPADAAAWALEDWQFAAACTEVALKQALPGPYTIGRRHAESRPGEDRDEATMAAAKAIRDRIAELIAAGCPYLEIHEPDATRIGDDDVERARYARAQTTLLEGVTGSHLSLAITAGNAADAGSETILAPGYHSLAVDLIAGPDNWRLVTAAPGSWGIVCGALSASAGSDDGPEVLVWATRYAASTGGRGLVRVGLGSASGLAHLSWTDALRKIERLGHAARLAGLAPGEELAGALDHRAQDLRTRAVGPRRKPRTVRSAEPPPKGT